MRLSKSWHSCLTLRLQTMRRLFSLTLMTSPPSSYLHAMRVSDMLLVYTISFIVAVDVQGYGVPQNPISTKNYNFVMSAK